MDEVTLVQNRDVSRNSQPRVSSRFERGGTAAEQNTWIQFPHCIRAMPWSWCCRVAHRYPCLFIPV